MTLTKERHLADIFASDAAIRETFTCLRSVSQAHRQKHRTWNAAFDTVDGAQCEQFLELALRISESEVEKRFLVSMVFFAVAELLPFQFALFEPADDLAAAVEYQRGWWRDLEKMEQAQGGSPPIDQALHALTGDAEISPAARSAYVNWWLYRDAVIATPQAKIPRADSVRSMRVDVALWDSNQDTPPVICEIDGYEWHGPKAAFVADRQRDRTLSQAGFRVIRFAASEVLANPIACVHDLIRVLRAGSARVSVQETVAPA